MKDSKKPAIFKADTLEEEVGMLTRSVVTNIVTAAKELGFDEDDADYTPVSLLVCSEIVAKASKTSETTDLMSFFFHVEDMLVAVESVSKNPLNPVRKGLMECAKAMCIEARKVVDAGFGFDPKKGHAYPEMILGLLRPFVPGGVDELRERVIRDLAQRQLRQEA